MAATQYSVLSGIKARLHDIAGDSSSGFWSEDNQTRAINIARTKVWSENFYEVVLRYIFNAEVNRNTYPVSAAFIPRFSTWDKLEFWQDGFPGATLPASATAVWGEPIWGTTMFGGTTPGTTPTSRQPPEIPTQTFLYAGPNFWDQHRSRKPVFSLRNDGATEGNRIVLVDPTPWVSVANGFVFYYFPNCIPMVTGDDTVSDALIEAYPLANELVAQLTKADLRDQEGLYDEGGAAREEAERLLHMMRTDLPRKTTQKQRSLRMQYKY